jgi:hypothetical protein
MPQEDGSTGGSSRLAAMAVLGLIVLTALARAPRQARRPPTAQATPTMAALAGPQMGRQAARRVARTGQRVVLAVPTRATRRGRPPTLRVPARDAPGTRDLPGVPRFAGAVLTESVVAPDGQIVRSTYVVDAEPAAAADWYDAHFVSQGWIREVPASVGSTTHARVAVYTSPSRSIAVTVRRHRVDASSGPLNPTVVHLHDIRAAAQEAHR